MNPRDRLRLFCSVLCWTHYCSLLDTNKWNAGRHWFWQPR